MVSAHMRVADTNPLVSLTSGSSSSSGSATSFAQQLATTIEGYLEPVE